MQYHARYNIDLDSQHHCLSDDISIFFIFLIYPQTWLYWKADPMGSTGRIPNADNDSDDNSPAKLGVCENDVIHVMTKLPNTDMFLTPNAIMTMCRKPRRIFEPVGQVIEIDDVNDTVSTFPKSCFSMWTYYNLPLLPDYYFLGCSYSFSWVSCPSKPSCSFQCYYQ